jgi:hypothetical protein
MSLGSARSRAQVKGVNTMMAPARTPIPRSSQNVVRRIIVYIMTM